MVSAYRDTDSSIVPVELLIKEYRNIKNKLYVSVTMNKIEETSLEAQPELPKGENSYNPKLVLTITLPELFSKFNPRDGNFLKVCSR